MEKSRNRTTKRRKPGDRPADTDPEIVEELLDESTEAKNSKLQCPCRIGLKFREESWHVQKLDFTHKGHKLLSPRAVAREERSIKPVWVAMIKDHGALGLSPSSCLELLENYFGAAPQC